MEAWFVILVSIILPCIILFRRNNRKKLPPGPSFFSSHLLLLTRSPPELQSIIKRLKSKYGPLVTLSIGTHPLVLIGNHSLSRQLLIHKATAFSDRPKAFRIGGIFSTPYGPTWRLFRYNLVSIFLHPSNIKSYSWARKSSINIIVRHLQETVGTVNVVDHIQLAMLRLSLMMCFGDDREYHDIARVQGGLVSLVCSLFFNAFLVSPVLAKILFRNSWKKYEQLREDQKELLISLIESRTEALAVRSEIQSVAYLDTLVKLQVPNHEETGGKLTQKEMVSMCGEFIVVVTETTTNALQWIMANLVKHPSIQSKLYDEIVSVIGQPPPLGVNELESVINEESLQKMIYLKAVVLEGLRRHPPGHLLLPHRVGEAVELQGYMIPKGASISFMVAEMGWDPEVWDDPGHGVQAREVLV
ncbi:hypothetical protein QVD17_04908 [Tagetes erecta]|uniref:Cytochrome P450 n=1 Tax=Tagetes erecta TaxID=13708 RepID=A0AAD8LDI7_TARER|nr:hypothetical protein QVD17_04908 [Tagetes erecta]